MIYAGSLVNPAVLDYTKVGCEIHDSARLTLEEVIALIEKAEAAGKTTVRLHTRGFQHLRCGAGAVR